MEAETRLADYGEVLIADQLKREEEARRAAAEREEAMRQLQEKEAALAAQAREKRALYEELSKEFGGGPGLVVHAMVRTHTIFRIILTMLTSPSQPCEVCHRSGEVCQGPEGKACTVCSEKHAQCSLNGR